MNLLAQLAAVSSVGGYSLVDIVVFLIVVYIIVLLIKKL